MASLKQKVYHAKGYVYLITSDNQQVYTAKELDRDLVNWSRRADVLKKGVGFRGFWIGKSSKKKIIYSERMPRVCQMQGILTHNGFGITEFCRNPNSRILLTSLSPSSSISYP